MDAWKTDKKERQVPWVQFLPCEGTVNDPRHQTTFQNINFQELLYADDTLIIAQSARTANAYLPLIEQESEYIYDWIMINAII